MGSIYRVRHRLLEEIRVVKVMKPSAVADADLRRRFVEEARTATRLKHPNICTIYDFAIDDSGMAYLVMEYIEGPSVADLLKLQGRPALPLALEIAHQSLLALGFLHRKGIVHRDVAPDNIMLTRDEQGLPLVKLIDLGIAKVAEGADRSDRHGRLPRKAQVRLAGAVRRAAEGTAPRRAERPLRSRRRSLRAPDRGPAVRGRHGRRAPARPRLCAPAAVLAVGPRGPRSRRAPRRDSQVAAEAPRGPIRERRGVRPGDPDDPAALRSSRGPRGDARGRRDAPAEPGDPRAVGDAERPEPPRPAVRGFWGRRRPRARPRTI